MSTQPAKKCAGIQVKASKEESKCFCGPDFVIEPTKEGVLSGLTFGVKDNIGVKGYVTAYGSPSWEKANHPEVGHAVCVDQCLQAGAKCVGKNTTDELTFSLDGENHFYGTPLNPWAPNRIPGGSSNGSATAVAMKFVDFSLGTDNGGSTRVPASCCGVYGMRPTHDLISTSGVSPFAPSTDTVGIFANDSQTLMKVSTVLLGLPLMPSSPPQCMYILKDAFDLASDSVRSSLKPVLEELGRQYTVKEVTLADIVGSDLPAAHSIWYWFDQIFKIVQWTEIWNSLGPWVEATNPELGPRTKQTLLNAKTMSRENLGRARTERQTLFRAVDNFLKAGDIVLLPTLPDLPPLKDSIGTDMMLTDFYPKTSAYTSFSGVAQLSTVSLPVATHFDGKYDVPVGLSAVAKARNDGFLLSAVQHMASTLKLDDDRRSAP